jgi:hypothetical protein
MSPEQAKGREADKRSDVWAFGCVLYEMLTGRRAFDGEDMTDVLGAVVRLEPNWAALPSEVPLPIRALLQGCLVKDRRRRVADISTALFVLDKAADLVSSAPSVPARTSASITFNRAAAIAMVAAAVAGVGVWMVSHRAPEATSQVARLTVTLPDDQRFGPGRTDRVRGDEWWPAATPGPSDRWRRIEDLCRHRTRHQPLLFTRRAVDWLLRSGKAQEGLRCGRDDPDVVRCTQWPRRKLDGGRRHLLRGGHC